MDVVTDEIIGLVSDRESGGLPLRRRADLVLRLRMDLPDIKALNIPAERYLLSDQEGCHIPQSRRLSSQQGQG